MTGWQFSYILSRPRRWYISPALGIVGLKLKQVKDYEYGLIGIAFRKSKYNHIDKRKY